VFQLFDGLQVLVIGLLRGIQDTAVPFAYAALSYWGVGLPLAYVLGFVLGGDEIGVWLGLVISLVAASGLLMVRFWRRARHRGPQRLRRTARMFDFITNWIEQGGLLAVGLLMILENVFPPIPPSSSSPSRASRPRRGASGSSPS
jgi:hypothetical protein